MSVKKHSSGLWTVQQSNGLVMFKSLSRKTCAEWLRRYNGEDDEQY